MASTKISGRFFPPRVYSRWKWTVRFGLLLVPFLVLLSGGVVLFLSPNKCRSTTLFGLENGPPPREIVELVKSRSVLDRVFERLELAHRFNMDKETAMGLIREATEVRIVPNPQPANSKPTGRFGLYQHFSPLARPQAFREAMLPTCRYFRIFESEVRILSPCNRAVATMI